MHCYLRKNHGRPTYCSNDKCQKVSKIFEWCLKTGRKYSHNPDDYLWLCRSCHRRYDLTEEKKEQAVKNLWWKAKRPHPTPNGCPENLWWMKDMKKTRLYQKTKKQHE